MFVPLLRPARYKGVHGGRGSGKSHFFAEALVERCLLQHGTRAVCIREVQKTLAQSVKQVIEAKIQTLGVGSYFDVQQTLIKAPGDGLIIFQGMQDHTAESIKSLEGYDIAYVEEAQSLTKRSLQLLRPTIRKDDSELWFAWNPRSDDDPIDDMFRGPKRLRGDDVVCVEANWNQNPWFPESLRQEMAIDLERSPDTFDHVWNGAYETISDAIIFRHRVEFRAFDTPPDARFYFGADWGFADDPAVLVRCFIDGETLYIDDERFGYHTELDDLAEVVFDPIPGSRKWPIKGDCSQPAQISYMRRQGFNITGADKWQGSVEDGVNMLKAFKKIVIHDRCPKVAEEFRRYSYKVDRLTGDILPVIVDKYNHGIDSLRYALGGFIQRGRGMKISDDVLKRSRLPLAYAGGRAY